MAEKETAGTQVDSGDVQSGFLPDTAHLEDATRDTLHIDEKNWIQVTEDGRAATAREHELSVMQAIKAYPKAVAWSVIISLVIVMEGYEIVLIGSLFGQPAFQKKYGEPAPATATGYQLTAPWQIGLANSSAVGAFIGACFNGWLSDRFGYRKVLLGSLVAVSCFIFITFFSPSIEVLLVGELLTSLPWGVFATSAPAYAAEVCPLALRGHLTIYVDLCWAMGQLIAAGVLDGVAGMDSKWAYKIPFAVQWAWPIPLFIAIYFAPESPWWLVRNGKIEQAKKSVKRLSSNVNQGSDQTVAMMVHTVNVEIEITHGGSYLDCFKGTDLRRTEIACLTFAAQCMCGLQLGGNPTYFFEQAGVPTSNSFKLTVGTLALACVGVFISLWLIGFMGRRPLYVGGLAVLSFIQLIVGIVSAASDSKASNYGQAGLIMFWLFFFYITIGPVCFPIIAEISSSRLRVQTVCLARNSYYVASIIANIINPYMLNPTAGDWKGKTAFFWAGSCAVCCLWAYYRLPETKDRTYEELDLLFAAKVPARKFATHKVDAYATVDGHAVVS